MLRHPTFDKLNTLRLFGMLHALEDQQRIPDSASLSFEERLGLLVDRELDERQSRRLGDRLKRAYLRQNATFEDVDFRHPRGLDRGLLLSLASCQWIRNRDNCTVTGATGTGKTFLACALAQKACREGFSVYYARTGRLLTEMVGARAQGTYERRLSALSRLDLLVLDDWAMTPLTEVQRRDLFEILDDRYDRHSTLVASQVPQEDWHETIGDPTLADAILDRLVHNAHRLCLKGPSMRKQRSRLAGTTPLADTAEASEASRDASEEVV
jgi:DNA replication protein DnaC